MMLMLVMLAQIVSTVPPLAPAEAVAVLRGSHSPQDLTDFRAAPPPELRPVYVVAPAPVAVVRTPAARESPPRPLQQRPTIGQCWVGVPCIVGQPEVIVREIRK